MARFLHIADARCAEHIRRSGILPSHRSGARAVFCVPVVFDYAKTFQWAREMRACGARNLISVFFDLPDTERVLVGRYGTQHAAMSAAQAHAAFLAAPGPAGQEVLVPRRVESREIKRVKSAPRLVGWRYSPEAKNNPPFYPYRGTINAARRRVAIDNRMACPWSELPS